MPTDSDWSKLVIFIDSGADTSSTSATQSSSAGTKLKKNSALWLTNTGTDDYGLSALPGGFRQRVGSFTYISSYAFFWSATEGGSGNAWYRDMNNTDGIVRRLGNCSGCYTRSGGASVRCLRD